MATPKATPKATPGDRPNPSVHPAFIDALLKKKAPEVVAWRNLAAEQLRTGKSLFNEGGALRPLLEMVINSALDEEKNEHLRQTREEGGIQPPERKDEQGGKELLRPHYRANSPGSGRIL